MANKVSSYGLNLTTETDNQQPSANINSLTKNSGYHSLTYFLNILCGGMMNKIFGSLIFVLLSIPIWSVYHMLGSYNNHPQQAHDVEVVNNTAYVAYGDAGFEIIDVSEPGNPQLLSSVSTQGDAYSVSIVDTLAYVSVNMPGLNIINIADPQNPQLISYYQINDSYFTLVHNGMAYFGGSNGIYIVDVSDPYNPLVMSNFVGNDSLYPIDVIDDLAYLFSGDNGFQILDVSDPQNPQLLGSYFAEPNYFTYGCIKDNIAYIASMFEGNILMLNVSNPSNPQFAGVLAISTNDDPFTIEGNTLFVPGVKLYDISNLQNPILIGSYDTAGAAESFDVAGNTLYFTTYYSGLNIIDISSPQDSLCLGTFPTSYLSAIELTGNIACIAEGSRFRTIDISNPQNPFLLGTYGHYNGIKSITIKENIAYLACGGGIDIVDISDPLHPIEIAFYDMFITPFYVYSIVFNGNIAYVADHYGLTILDMTNPQSPLELGSYHHGYSTDVIVRGTTVFLVNGNHTFEILDASNPQNIQLISSSNLRDVPRKMGIYNNSVYIAEGDAGVESFDVTNTSNPSLSATILPHPTSYMQACYVKDNLLFLSDTNWNEIGVYNMNALEQPELINIIAWNHRTVDMRYHNDRLYTASGSLNILDLGFIVPVSDPICLPKPAISISNYPNPFNPNTTIRFDIQQAGLVELDIYNIKGQKVKTLVHEQLTKGNHTISWNGTDDESKSIASGVYFARLSTHNANVTRKMVLVK